jgi:hypothetical protein
MSESNRATAEQVGHTLDLIQQRGGLGRGLRHHDLDP